MSNKNKLKLDDKMNKKIQHFEQKEEEEDSVSEIFGEKGDDTEKPQKMKAQTKQSVALEHSDE